ncbi:hypothetical protein VKT23_016223 [Stygiomarasmius scandens]|uniref:Uncharacterized protein n=1 Tax=Marasmiellus scandens TaxID=2682957 RepID=A0ABR1IYM1_9AGAR
MVNPFIDDQAYESDDDLYADTDIENGGRGAEATDSWNDEDNPEVHDEDCLVDLGCSNFPPQSRLEAVTNRLLARYVQAGDDQPNPHSSRQAPLGADTIHGEEQDNPTLRRILCSKDKQVFWQVKCKPGSEMELIFDIMSYGQGLVGPASSSESSSVLFEVPAQQLTLAGRALKTIRQYALTQEGEPKTIADELEKVLGSEWSVEWTRLIDAARMEPGEDDVQAALNNVNQMAAVFLPSSVLKEANSDTLVHSTSLLPSIRYRNNSSFTPGGASTILSAFSMPTMSGFVYLEGYYDDDWLEWLMQRSMVVKKAHSKIWIEPVECEDVGILLDTPISSIHPMSWVRVKHGLYRGDVGFVTSKEMRGGHTTPGALFLVEKS